MRRPTGGEVFVALFGIFCFGLFVYAMLGLGADDGFVDQLKSLR